MSEDFIKKLKQQSKETKESAPIRHTIPKKNVKHVSEEDKTKIRQSIEKIYQPKTIQTKPVKLYSKTTEPKEECNTYIKKVSECVKKEPIHECSPEELKQNWDKCMKNYQEDKLKIEKETKERIAKTERERKQANKELNIYFKKNR